MKELIDKWINHFPKMTKDESDYIKDILEWDDELKISFLLAKNIFETDDEN